MGEGSKMKRAIVVDDSHATRMILRDMLVDLGFEVDEADDGDTALDKLRTLGPADLALVDWHMPKMNGIELVSAVRDDESMDGMKIVMVTTESAMESVVEALDRGADEFVMKPFTKDIIREKLQLLGLSV